MPLRVWNAGVYASGWPELHALKQKLEMFRVYKSISFKSVQASITKVLEAGLEPAISSLGGRRLIR